MIGLTGFANMSSSWLGEIPILEAVMVFRSSRMFCGLSNALAVRVCQPLYMNGCRSSVPRHMATQEVHDTIERRNASSSKYQLRHSFLADFQLSLGFWPNQGEKVPSITIASFIIAPLISPTRISSELIHISSHCIALASMAKDDSKLLLLSHVPISGPLHSMILIPKWADPQCTNTS